MIPPGLPDNEKSNYEMLIDLVKDSKQQPRVVSLTDLTKDHKISRKAGGEELLQGLYKNTVRTEQQLTLSFLEDLYTFYKNRYLVKDAVGNIVLQGRNTIASEELDKHFDVYTCTIYNFMQERKIPSTSYAKVAAVATPLTSDIFAHMADTKKLLKDLFSLKQYQDSSFYKAATDKSNVPAKRFAPFMDQKWWLTNKTTWFDDRTESTNIAKEAYTLNDKAGFEPERQFRRRKWNFFPMPSKTSFKRKALRILLNGEECLARPDTGSEKNIMTEETAKKHSIPIRCSEADKSLFQLGTGKYIQSIGRAYVPYRIFGDGSSSEYGWFHILKQCAAPLIIGMELINKIKLYTKHRHLLVDCPSRFGSISTLKWIGSPQGRINFSAGGRSFFGCADTGSDLDFMSLHCALKSGFMIDRRASQRTCVMIADGTIVETVGKVHITSMCLGSFQLFDIAFHVLPGLPTEVIFGEEFLDRIDAFNTCTELMDTEDPHQHSLNTLINLGPIQAFLSRIWAPKISDIMQQEHDSKIEAEFHRRNKARRAISRIMGHDRVEAAKAVEEAGIVAFDTGHVGCTHCIGRNVSQVTT